MSILEIGEYPFDFRQLVDEICGYAIRQQLSRRPNMIGHTGGHGWGWFSDS